MKNIILFVCIVAFIVGCYSSKTAKPPVQVPVKKIVKKPVKKKIVKRAKAPIKKKVKKPVKKLVKKIVKKPEFIKIKNLSQIEGIYRNRGRSKKGSTDVYFSSIIWPDSHLAEHPSIETIKIIDIQNQSLLIQALSNNVAVNDEMFDKGKVFKIISGHLFITRANLKDPEAEPTKKTYKHYGKRISFTGKSFMIKPKSKDLPETIYFKRLRLIKKEPKETQKKPN